LFFLKAVFKHSSYIVTIYAWFYDIILIYCPLVFKDLYKLASNLIHFKTANL